jgi:phosphatidylethanolamine/phosphatidyl-N-methylethanolamine N-methyltransferase
MVNKIVIGRRTCDQRKRKGYSMSVRKTKASSLKETFLFIKRWVKHPVRLGAIAPSSPALANLVSTHVSVRKNHVVVEIGGGTGTVTRSLLKSGIPSDQLIVVELDPELCAFLKRTVPSVHVIKGNAMDLEKLIPQEYIGKVSTIISGIPVTTMSFSQQQLLINACMGVLAPGGELIQYSYLHKSPLPADAFGLHKERIGKTFKNIIPAYLWRYQTISS